MANFKTAHCMPSVKKFRHRPGQTRPNMSDLHHWFENNHNDLKQMSRELGDLSRQMRAEGKQSILVIFQALDAAGKDSTVRNVFRDCDPGLLHVHSFKAPSKEEAAHDFMWRCYPHFPAQGEISVFNRSYYEETLVVRVHPHFLGAQKIDVPVKKSFWQQRFDTINRVEKHLTQNRTQVIKFMLDIGKDVQRERLVRRYANQDKNWKFNINDLKERDHWDQYQIAFDDMLDKTSSDEAPWYIIPADDKQMMRLLVATIMTKRLKKMNPQWPPLKSMNENELALLAETLKSGAHGAD